MWGEVDYVCGNHADADKIWTDADKIKRKAMDEKGECKVACPKGQSWMAPDIPTMTCSKGKWESSDGKEVTKINCKTASKVYVLLLLIIVIKVSCGYALYRHYEKKKAEEAAAHQESHEGDGHDWEHEEHEGHEHYEEHSIHGDGQHNQGDQHGRREDGGRVAGEL